MGRMKPSAWIKRLLPRGLYGRAALILIVPVVTIQLVVSSVFLQRHFEDVTRQLTGALSLDLNLILATMDEDGPVAAQALARAVSVDIGEPRIESGNHWYFYDLSGVIVIETLEQRVPGVIGVDLRSNEREVHVVVDRGAEPPLAMTITRRRASAAAPHQLLVIMVATGVLMTLVAFVFLRNQLRPIRRLAEAAEAFGKGRRTEYHPSGALEVRSAGRAFLDMRARIEGYLEQRTLMLSGVSHDLRTPLTRMRLALGMLEDVPERAELVQDVDEMEALLNTFLDFARGDALDDLELTDPMALVSRVVENARRGGGEVALGGDPCVLLTQGPGRGVPVRPMPHSAVNAGNTAGPERRGRQRAPGRRHSATHHVGRTHLLRRSPWHGDRRTGRQVRGPAPGCAA